MNPEKWSKLFEKAVKEAPELNEYVVIDIYPTNLVHIPLSDKEQAVNAYMDALGEFLAGQDG